MKLTQTSPAPPAYRDFALEMNEIEFAILDDILVLFKDAIYEHKHGDIGDIDEDYLTDNRNAVASKIRTAIMQTDINTSHQDRHTYSPE